MKIDLYTKLVLTVIALSLSAIAAKDWRPVENAKAAFYTGQYAMPTKDSDAKHVIIDEISPNALSGPLPVQIDKVGGSLGLLGVPVHIEQ